MTDKEAKRHRLTERFPVIEIARADLVEFFSENQVESLSDGDMRSIADRWGDWLYEEFGLADGFSILGEIAEAFIGNSNKAS